MPEKITPKHTSYERSASSSDQHAENGHNRLPHHESLTTHEQTQSVEALRHTIDAHALSKDTHTHHTPVAQHERPHHYITRTVKRGVYAHTMKDVQTHLKPSERVFSKVVHNDTIETISELGAGSIARPSAILGGGICMVFGGVGLLMIAKYFGFTLPLSSLIALYIIGFIALFVTDIISKPFRRRLSKKHR